MAGAQSDRRKAPRPNDPQLRGRRVEPRACIVLPATVDALSGRRRISLLDVSHSGARLEGPDLPAAGRDVILRCGEVDTFGMVIWTVPGRCGVQFDDPISTPELIALREVAVAAEQAGMTPEELQAAADWMNGLAR
jgi:hypothetical protein